MFIEELTTFLHEKDSFHAAAIGDEGLRAFSQLVVQRAHVHQLTQKSTVKLFGQLMMYLGTYFDTDPALPWAALILQQPQDSVTTQTNRANLLREEFVRYLEATSGRKGEHLQLFLSQCKTALETELGSLPERDLTEFVERNYPEKYNNFPAGVLGQYVRIARGIADQATLKYYESNLTIFCLMVVYGYGVCSDPLFPWLQKFVQKAPDMDNPDAVLQRLTQKFLGEIATYVDSRAKRRT